MKHFKLIIFFLAFNLTNATSFAQANPYVAVLPDNSGLVGLGATLNLQITIGNTSSASIAAFKLRPVFTLPAIANFLPDAQQTGLPVGWSIVSNIGSQIRICNGTDVIAGSTSRTIILKIQGTSIGGPFTFSGQINFGGANCGVSGPAPSGNNSADDFSTSTIQVVAGCSLGVTAVASTILCNGGTSNITATATNATSGLEYSITRITGQSAFQSSNIFTNELAGNYTVTARDVSNPSTCVAISNFITITEPTAIPAQTLSVIQPTCSLATGLVSITSPTTGLFFSIDGSTTYLNYTGAISLATGVHSIRAKNNNNCFSPITSFIIDAQPVTPTTPIIGTITQPNCVVSTGSVVLSGLPAGDWIINPVTIVGNSTSTTINALAAGTYNLTVTNSSGCISPAASININSVAGAPVTPSTLIIQPTCTNSTGAVTITSSTAGLTFSLDGGIYTVYPTAGYTSIGSGTHTLIAKNTSDCLSPIANFIINTQPISPTAATVNVLQPSCTSATGTINITSPTVGLSFSFDGSAFGTYPANGYTAATGLHSIAVQNTTGCSASYTNNIIVNVQPTTPSAIISTPPITCFGSNTIITVDGYGGILPYQYSLNNATFQTGNTYTAIAGTYNLAIKDASGCIGLYNNLIVTQPTQITATLVANTIACSGNNATLSVLTTGGTGAFEFSLNNGTTYQVGNTFSVVAGTYIAKVRTIANPTCTTTTSSLIIQQPDSLKVSSSAEAINKCGTNTIIKVGGVGGKAPYAGVGNFTRGPGTWRFTITDANGCTAETTKTILPPGCVDLKIFPNPVQSIITVNHSKAIQESVMQIFGSNGALIMQKIIPANSFLTIIDVSKLANGVYILVYKNGKELNEIKFVKTSSK